MFISLPSLKFSCTHPPLWPITDLLSNLQIFFINSHSSRTGFFFFFFLAFSTEPTAYGRSQARGGMRAAARATATATPGPSLVCDLHHSSLHCWILNPLSEARDQTSILMDTSRVGYHWATMGTPHWWYFEFSHLLTDHVRFYVH